MEDVIRIGAIIIQNKSLLLVKGKEFNELWIPGGKLESESEEECLKRELKEEINVLVRNMKFFGEFSSPSFYSHHNTVNRLYITEIEGDPKPHNEIEKVVWLSKEEFEDKTYKMIPVIEEEIIPSLISKGYF